MSKKVMIVTSFAVATAFAIGGCSSGAPADGGATEGAVEVNVLAYAALFEDKYTEAVIAKFEAEHENITVNFVPAQNSAEMLGKLRSEADNPTVDVAILDASVANTGNKEGLFSKITSADVPNIESVVELGQNAEGYGPAVTFDNLVLLYNPENVTDKPTKLADLWNAPDNSIALPAPPDIQGIAFTALTANNLGVDHQRDIGPAIDELAKLAPKVATWEPQPDVYQTITSGAASHGIGWNARGQVFAEESDGRLAVVQPADGIAFQINTINAVEGSKNPEAALEFINYALSEEAQMSFAEAMFYAPTVSGVELPAELAERVAQPDDPEIVPIDWIWMADERDAWTDEWRRNVIGG